MKPSHTLLCTLPLFLFTACGGGGDDAPSAPPTTVPAAALAAFEGIWHSKPGMECLPGFDYNPAYFFRLREALVAAAGGGLEVTFAVEIFDDAACANKRGLLTERLMMNMVPTTVSGRTGVYRSEPSLTLSTMSADGGAGFTLTKVPDGEVSDMNGRRMLVDVVGTQLDLTSSDDPVPLDTQGFPTQFDANKYLVR